MELFSAARAGGLLYKAASLIGRSLLHAGRPAAGAPPSGRRVNYRELQQRANELLQEAIARRRPMRGRDWDELAEAYRGLLPGTSQDTIDHRALNACREARDLAAARSLIRHRRAAGAVPAANLATFLELLSVCGDGGRGDDDALEAHAALAAMSLDRVSAARAVVGLSAGRHWRLALEHLPAARQGGFAPRGALSALAAAAFRGGDDRLGWTLLGELSAELTRPEDGPLDAWLQRCEARGHGEARARLAAAEPAAAELEPAAEAAAGLVVRLLQYLAESGVILNTEQALRLREIVTSRLAEPWTGEATHVSNRGRCEHCGLVLPESALADAEFAELREALVQRVLLGDDVFQTSTPEEVARFRGFVERTAPYDVVVDGLNVSFACSHVKGQPLSRALVQCVDHFAVQEGKKVLVIGRYHMRGWKKKDMHYVKRHAQLFTADNMSSDDAFLLYAVMHSHRKTQFVTRDFFRDHAARLPPTTRSKFNQLVRSNRITVDGVTPRGNLKLKMPIVHEVRTQVDPAGGWHVPFTDQPQPGASTATPSPTQPVTDRWLCLRPAR